MFYSVVGGEVLPITGLTMAGGAASALEDEATSISVKLDMSKTAEIVVKDKALTKSLVSSIASFNAICLRWPFVPSMQSLRRDRPSEFLRMNEYFLRATQKPPFSVISSLRVCNIKWGNIYRKLAGIDMPDSVISDAENVGTSGAERAGIQLATKIATKAAKEAEIQTAEDAEPQSGAKAEAQAPERTGFQLPSKGGEHAIGSVIASTMIPSVMKEPYDTAAATLRDFSEDLSKELEDVKVNLNYEMQDFIDWLNKLEKAVEKITKATVTDRELSDLGDDLMNLMLDKMPVFHSALTRYDKKNALVKGLKRFYHEFDDELKKKHEELKKKTQMKRGQRHYHLIMVSHGVISLQSDPILQLAMECLKDIVFYSPWGCAVDSTVVHGIATGTISPSQRRFAPAVSPPPGWNNLENHPGAIPAVELVALEPEHSGYQDLVRWRTFVNANPERLVIPFMQVQGEEAQSIRSIPLWLMAGIYSLIGIVLGKSFTYHHAACLGKNDNNSWHQHPLHGALAQAFDDQYCFLDSDTIMFAPGIDGGYPQFGQFQTTLDPLL